MTTTIQDQDSMLFQTLWLLAQMTPEALRELEPKLTAIVEESEPRQERTCSREQMEKILTTGTL